MGPMFHFLACAALPLLIVLPPSTPQSKSAKDKKVIAEAQAYMDSCTAFGWSGTVLIERKGKVLLHQGFG